MTIDPISGTIYDTAQVHVPTVSTSSEQPSGPPSVHERVRQLEEWQERLVSLCRNTSRPCWCGFHISETMKGHSHHHDVDHLYKESTSGAGAEPNNTAGSHDPNVSSDGIGRTAGSIPATGVSTHAVKVGGGRPFAIHYSKSHGPSIVGPFTVETASMDAQSLCNDLNAAWRNGYKAGWDDNAPDNTFKEYRG